MSFIEQIKQRAKQEIKTIVLPEATDVRILEAAEMIKNEGYAKVILIGNEEEVRKLAKETFKLVSSGDSKRKKYWYRRNKNNWPSSINRNC